MARLFENTAAAVGLIESASKAYSSKYKVTAAGLLTQLKLKNSGTASTCTSLNVSIHAHNATTGNAEKEPLAGGEVVIVKTPGANEEFTVEGFNLNLTEGQEVWLVTIGIGGAFRPNNVATGGGMFKSTTAVTKSGEVAAWVAEGEHAQIWVIGETAPIKADLVDKNKVSGSAERNAELRPAITVKVSVASAVEVAGGGRFKASLLVKTGGSSATERNAATSPALLTRVLLESQTIVGTAKTNQYYGPPGEEAAERALAEAASPKFKVPSRFLDILPSATPNSPVCIFVHGGGWTTGDKSEFATEVKGLQKKGITVFNINYRESNPNNALVSGFPKEGQDIEEAVQYAIAHAVAFNGNTARLFILGGSAGGQLVIRVAQRMNAERKVFAGVISLSGPACFKTLIEEMEAGTYPVIGAPAQKGQEDVTQHVQDSMQCTISGAFGIGGGLPSCGSEAKLNLAASESGDLNPSPSNCKWLLFNATEETFKLNQMNNFKAHLEAEGKRVTTYEIAGNFHSFGYWETSVDGLPTHRVGTYAIANFILADEPEANLVTKVTLASNTTRITSISPSITVHNPVVSQFARATFPSLNVKVKMSDLARREVTEEAALNVSTSVQGNFFREGLLRPELQTKIRLTTTIVAQGVFRANLRTTNTVRSAVSRNVSLSSSIRVKVSGSTSTTKRFSMGPVYASVAPVRSFPIDVEVV